MNGEINLGGVTVEAAIDAESLFALADLAPIEILHLDSDLLASPIQGVSVDMQSIQNDDGQDAYRIAAVVEIDDKLQSEEMLATSLNLHCQLSIHAPQVLQTVGPPDLVFGKTTFVNVFKVTHLGSGVEVLVEVGKGRLTLANDALYATHIDKEDVIAPFKDDIKLRAYLEGFMHILSGITDIAAAGFEAPLGDELPEVVRIGEHVYPIDDVGAERFRILQKAIGNMVLPPQRLA